MLFVPTFNGLHVFMGTMRGRASSMGKTWLSGQNMSHVIIVTEDAV